MNPAHWAQIQSCKRGHSKREKRLFEQMVKFWRSGYGAFPAVAGSQGGDGAARGLGIGAVVGDQERGQPTVLDQAEDQVAHGVA